MRKFSIFLFLSLLLLQSCQPAAKAASFPLTASHIKAATETVYSQILEKDSETQLYHAIREWESKSAFWTSALAISGMMELQMQQSLSNIPVQGSLAATENALFL